MPNKHLAKISEHQKRFSQEFKKQQKKVFDKIKKNKQILQQELHKKEKQQAVAILSVLIVIFISISVVFFVNEDKILTFIQTTSGLTSLLFILVICIEVIIAPIPGGVIALTIAASQPTINALIIIYLGSILGSIAAYTFARYLGKNYVYVLIPEKKVQKAQEFATKYAKWLPLIYAVPIFPIDVINFINGLLKVPVHLLARALILGYFFYAFLIVGLGKLVTPLVQGWFAWIGTAFFVAVIIALIVQTIHLLYADV